MIPIILALLGVGLYLRHVNTIMKAVPPEATAASPHRWTIEQIKAGYKKALENPVEVDQSLPPKQARRYVVVGGSGLVGGWIVSHLLARGEDPSAIRVLDLLAPTQQVLQQGVGYVKTNISDDLAVTTAFESPWPESIARLPLTVFHTAAIIRPQDRLEIFLPLCSNVNIEGTRNVLNAARKVGASCFVSTSSGSVSLHKLGFWVAPWKKLPQRAFQVLSDEAKVPQEHNMFFGNYAVTKVEAEKMVREADDPSSNFRTGCIRPANGIYGIGSDASMTLTGVYLRNQGSPTWTRPVIQSFVNAENVSIAHLLYEQRLLEQSQPTSNLPNTGGQSFVVTDPNPAVSFSDIYTLLETLSKTPVSFPSIPPVPFFVFSYLVEFYSVIQYKYLQFLPKLTGDLSQVQPALFSISDVFCIADDSRARKAPELGGLGYNPPLSTLEGMCKQLVDWNRKAELKEVDVDVAKIGPVAVSEKGVDVNLVSPKI
ncbi:hypothetical protein N7532_010160 [Penicillium argentinense]|uniref:3-beta hydroxysteroid dehydrogenase/isomerase domain-containing protein n=1 Tax=Penicillium argentinense TaxID=1131581 RepID=A0A9W9EPE6_9EURO|nr:uncharacterized protein N7532_010160 [Penicillium argentinense]KAJ5085389.1 hypothetical protein N7532_010160 [Penicillium argentinense]